MRASSFMARQMIDRAGHLHDEDIIAGWLELIEDRGCEQVALDEGWQPEVTDARGRHIPTHDPDDGRGRS